LFNLGILRASVFEESKTMEAKRSTVLSVLLVGGLLVFGRAYGDAVREVGGDELARATFAGGCFWCMEHPFDELEGVISTTVGYTGGHTKDPTYEEVSAGGTGHTEAVQIVYNPKKISYTKLLEVFWRNIDPLTKDKQFCDKGSQYRTGIFFHDENQKHLAEQSKKTLEESKRFQQPIVTETTPASEFYVAEEYHQGYYRTHAFQYKVYRYLCGRDQRLHELWGETN
jgi:peptide-methionine (S)-S-oxide reductase